VAHPIRFFAAGVLATAAACSGGHVVVAPAPASPEATVGQFLAAVNANDHGRMAALWGDEHGSSSTVMRNAARRDSLMTIYQHLLATDSVRLVGSEPLPGNASRRLLRMELFHGGKAVTVPFTLAPQRAGGWLVMAFDPEPLMPQVNAPARP